MSKLYCGICLSHEHNSAHCPRLANRIAPIIDEDGTVMGDVAPPAVTKPVTKVIGRPKRYETPAERQKAYRERKK